MDDLKLEPGVFVATIKPFNGSNLRPSEDDKNHLSPIILDVVAGTCPNKRVLSGTVAKRAGMIEGNTYLCKYEEIEDDEYGRQFRFSTISKLGTNEILNAIQSLGMPRIVEVVKNEPEISKSGHYTYPKGFTVEEKAKFDAMSADEQDAYLENHTEIRVHKLG